MLQCSDAVEPDVTKYQSPTWYYLVRKNVPSGDFFSNVNEPLMAESYLHYIAERYVGSHLVPLQLDWVISCML